MTYKPTRAELDTGLSITRQMANNFARKHSQDADELYSLGLEKLAEVINRYDASYKAPFTAWIRICLGGHMLNYIRDNSRLIRMPRKELYAYMRMHRLAKQTGITNSQTLARLANVAPQELAESQQVYGTSFISDTCLIEKEYQQQNSPPEHVEAIDYLAELTDKQLEVATKFFTGEVSAQKSASLLGKSQDDFNSWVLGLKAKCYALVQGVDE